MRLYSGDWLWNDETQKYDEAYVGAPNGHWSGGEIFIASLEVLQAIKAQNDRLIEEAGADQFDAINIREDGFAFLHGHDGTRMYIDQVSHHAEKVGSEIEYEIGFGWCWCEVKPNEVEKIVGNQDMLDEPPKKEESVEAEQIKSTVVVTDEEVAAAARNIQHGITEWEQGRMTSPDQRDYVIDCCRAIGADWHEYEEIVNEIAEEIFEDSGEELVTVEAIAKYGLTRLKESGVESDEPKSEYLVHLNIQLPREKRIDIAQVEREINGALEVGLGSEEYAPGLQGADIEIALAEEIG